MLGYLICTCSRNRETSRSKHKKIEDIAKSRKSKISNKILAKNNSRPFLLRSHQIYKHHFVSDLQDIMRCLLAKHPSHRPTLEEVIQHPWLQHRRYKGRPSIDRRTCQSAPIPRDIQGNMPRGKRDRQFQKRNSLL